MPLTEEEKRKIREEEELREQIRAGSEEEEKKKTSSCATLGCLAIIVLLVISGGSFFSKVPSTNETPTNEAAPKESVEERENLTKRLAETYCEKHTKHLNSGEIKVACNSLKKIFEEWKDKYPDKVPPSYEISCDGQEACRVIVEVCVIEADLGMWSREDCEKIAKAEIWMNMLSFQTVLSWGIPRDKNRSVFSFGVHEQWVYGDPLYDAVYLYFEGKDDSNLKLTSWQD